MVELIHSKRSSRQQDFSGSLLTPLLQVHSVSSGTFSGRKQFLSPHIFLLTIFDIKHKHKPFWTLHQFRYISDGQGGKKRFREELIDQFILMFDMELENLWTRSKLLLKIYFDCPIAIFAIIKSNFQHVMLYNAQCPVCSVQCPPLLTRGQRLNREVSFNQDL